MIYTFLSITMDATLSITTEGNQSIMRELMQGNERPLRATPSVLERMNEVNMNTFQAETYATYAVFGKEIKEGVHIFLVPPERKVHISVLLLKYVQNKMDFLFKIFKQ